MNVRLLSFLCSLLQENAAIKASIALIAGVGRNVECSPANLPMPGREAVLG